MEKLLESASEKGASSWLTALPLSEEGFALNVWDFRDALALRYGWEIKDLYKHCQCGAKNSPGHAMNCPKGGFIYLRHNTVRDVFINVFKQAGYKDVEEEPTLHPIDRQTLSQKSVITGDEARSDIKVLSFWRPLQKTFFDVRIFNPFSSSYIEQSLTSSKNLHEKEKKRKYEERIRDVEMSSFSPLVFTFFGGAGRETDVVIKKLVSELSIKRDEPYSDVIRTFRTKLSFALLHASLLCLRGTKNWNDHKKHQNSTPDIVPDIFKSISTHKNEVEFGLVHNKASLKRY